LFGSILPVSPGLCFGHSSEEHTKQNRKCPGKEAAEVAAAGQQRLKVDILISRGVWYRAALLTRE
jgi:hypothetical protein